MSPRAPAADGKEDARVAWRRENEKLLGEREAEEKKANAEVRATAAVRPGPPVSPCPPRFDVCCVSTTHVSDSTRLSVSQQRVRAAAAVHSGHCLLVAPPRRAVSSVAGVLMVVPTQW